MSLHEESVELERVLARMRSELLHLDDNYRSAADLLVRYTAGRRSFAEQGGAHHQRYCTGSQADPACRRQHGSGGATGVLAKDIDIANQRLERIVVPDDVKARFTRHVARIPSWYLATRG